MATIYWRGRCASLNWVEAGERRRESLGVVAPAEAEAALQGLHRRLAGQDHGGAGPIFVDWAQDYALWHRDEYPDSYTRVEQILRCYLIPYFGLMPIGAITRQDVEGYKHGRLGAAAAGTITKELRTLQAALNKAVDWEVIPVNRAKGVRPPKDVTSRPPRWYTREELAAIYAADALHAHIWRLMVNTGLRRGEAQQLRRQDVGEDAIRVVSNPGARTKSAKWRLVPITPGARIALQGLQGAGDLVVPRMTADSLTHCFTRALDRVGLDGSLHCLRHTYCSHLVMAGVHLRTVQVLAGHSTILVTEKYAHLAPTYLQDATRGLEL
jgi:integrase